MIKTRIESVDRDIAIIIAEELSPEARSKHFANFAREVLADNLAQNRAALGRDTTYETYVDGRADARFESVKPDGVIVFEFNLFDDILIWIDDELRRASPVKTGRYQQSHILLADGAQAAVGFMEGNASEYVFVNAQPYARKIERGLSPKAPDGVYEGVAVMASRRFGNMARIRFGYRSLVGAYVPLGGKRGGKKAGAEKRAAHRAEQASRNPAIIITPR